MLLSANLLSGSYFTYGMKLLYNQVSLCSYVCFTDAKQITNYIVTRALFLSVINLGNLYEKRPQNDRRFARMVRNIPPNVTIVHD